MTPERDTIARALPGYEIGEEIGAGAFGVVYAGRHRSLGRNVAIKLLPAGVGADPSMRERFSVEARVVAGLDHPHIVPVYDFVEHDGMRLLVLEYLSDGTLSSRMRGEAKHTPQWACAVGIAVALGLQHAHDRGVLHRDVKPDNILFAGDTPKLADFGIAKETHGDAGLTQTGMVIGTVSYMSPEQASGETIGAPSDTYSCAIVVYEMLAGRLPFPPVTTLTGQLLQRVTARPEPLRNVDPALPGEISDVLAAALERVSSDRTPSAGVFAVQLDSACRRAYGEQWLSQSGVRVVGLDSVAAKIANASAAHPVPSVGRPTTGVPEAATRLAAGVGASTVNSSAPPVIPSPTAIPSRRIKFAALGLAALVGLGAVGIAISRGGNDGQSAVATTDTSATVSAETTIVQPATTVAATTVAPTSVAATSTTLPVTTAAPTTAVPTTAVPTTVAPVTVIVTVLVPATAAPTSAPPKTAPPTQPPPTQPPATQPPATQPPATQPPATQPPATQPPTAGRSPSPRFVAMLEELNRVCLDRGRTATECTCVTMAANDLPQPQLAALLTALVTNARLGPRPRAILERCGITLAGSDPNGAATTAPSINQRRRKR